MVLKRDGGLNRTKGLLRVFCRRKEKRRMDKHGLRIAMVLFLRV